MPRENKDFKLLEGANPPCLQAPLLAGAGLVEHSFSTRLGGCSSGSFQTLNMAFHNGDSAEMVLENRRRFFSAFGFDFRGIVSSTQVHGTGIAYCGPENRGEGALPQSPRRRADALVTTTPGLVLSAYSADCQLIFVAARSKPLVALAHAGWRGALAGIGVRLIRTLSDRFGLLPGELLVALGPAICPDCYSVGDEVAGSFRQGGWDDPLFLKRAAAGKWKLDLAAINAAQLLQAGIKEENLARSKFCTSCRPDLLFSYRRDRGRTGRMIGFIAIK